MEVATHRVYLTVGHPGLCKELTVGHPLDFSLGDIAKELWYWPDFPRLPHGSTSLSLSPVDVQNMLSGDALSCVRGHLRLLRLPLFTRETQEVSLQLNEAMGGGYRHMHPPPRGTALGHAAASQPCTWLGHLLGSIHGHLFSLSSA